MQFAAKLADRVTFGLQFLEQADPRVSVDDGVGLVQREGDAQAVLQQRLLQACCDIPAGILQHLILSRGIDGIEIEQDLLDSAPPR